MDSTNDYLRRENLPDRTMVYTFHQTAGRGRSGRKWVESRRSNLALSVMIKPDALEVPFWRIALLALPMVELLRARAIDDVWIKWPNDIYVGSKKIAGVLAESVIRGSKLERIVAGIGINVNSTAEELQVIGKPATSLFCETGELQELESFAADYIARLSRMLDNNFSWPTIRTQWLAESGMVGRWFTWFAPQGAVEGRVVDVDAAGILILETAAGISKITAGDIEVAGARLCQP